MSGEVLFLAHRMPFPADRGDKIRSSHILRAIAAQAPVHVATFAENADDYAQEPVLSEVAASYCLAARKKPLVLAGAEALLRDQPVSLTAFHSCKLADFVARTIAERPIAAIYVFSGQMGQYVPDDFPGRVVLDLVDVDSAKFEAYAAGGSGPRSWLDAREARLLAAEEARQSLRSAVTLFVSDEEAVLFRSRSGLTTKVQTLRNGIDSQFFDPASVDPAIELAPFPSPRLIFTGQMDYAPNIAAAHRALTRLLPLIRARIPQATLHIVGRNPPATLQALHGKDGGHVWGGVPDIRSWLKGADLAVVPLEIARGVQNKVLEAMAMARPVVASSGAATGIGAVAGQHLAIADSDEAIADACCALLTNHEAAADLGRRARDFVVSELSWAATLAQLPGLLRKAPLEAARHAA